jgi:hypothetical protein
VRTVACERISRRWPSQGAKFHKSYIRKATMRSPTCVLAATAIIGLALSGCGEDQPLPANTAASTTPIDSASPTTAPTVAAAADSIIGTVLRFTAPDGSVDVTIDQDNPATRDLLSILPLTLTFEDFAGKEKIAYPPRELQTAGSPPSSAGAGDLAIYTPWGDIAFFYEGERGTASANIVHLGTFDASPDQLQLLEGGPVTVDLVE